MLLGTGRTLSFEYDNLLRISKKNVSGVYQHRRNYLGTGTANRQSNRIQYYVFASADGADTKMTYRYDYDAAGNINEVYRQITTGSLDFLSSFEYDKLGQLTKAQDSRGIETFTYDTAGNIRSRTLDGDTVTYSYDNASWNDLLTSYDGQKIAYEGQTYNASGNTVSGTVVSGNPVSYYNGNRWDMEWTNGSQLAEASSNDTVVSYTYNRAGLRATKTVDGVTYHYAYAGDKLVWQEWDGNEMFFFYDESNAPVGFWYHPSSGSNVTGYYMTTQQGDITRVEDVNGNVLATYEYDAWGRLISSGGSLAEINPLRYRGYYFDTETGFYYLQSRYYDPVVSRFINADKYASTGTGLLSYNMFAYCQNNPVNYSDPQGTMQLVANDGRPSLIGGALSGIKIGLDAINQGGTNGGSSKTDYGFVIARGESIAVNTGIWSFEIQYGFAMDLKGNVAIQFSPSGGVSSGGGLSLSKSQFVTYTNASSVYDLAGSGYQMGGSASIPVLPPMCATGGADLVTFPAPNGKDYYTGVSLSAGIGLGAGYEAHASWGETNNIYTFNIFNFFQNFAG